MYIQLGLRMANKVLTMLLLRVPMCRASEGQHCRKNKAGQSSYSNMRIVLH